MNKQWGSITGSILSAAAALLLCLAWGTGRSVSGTAAAAPLDATPAPPLITDGLPVPPGETAWPDAGSTDSATSYGWLIECADCPKSD